MTGPLLTRDIHATLQAAAAAGAGSVECSLDLGRSMTSVEPGTSRWIWRGQQYPYIESCRDRTIYYWTGSGFEPAARYTHSLFKLVPTEWGAPTFEIDGIKMLPSAELSPYEDAQRKVGWVRPRGKVVLDTCGGLGYFAAWCLAGGAARVLSYEKNPEVIWLRGLNPWSPAADEALSLTEGDITNEIEALPAESIDAVLHDPPRFGIAGELYAADFYAELARVLKPGGRLFHYTGKPNALTSGRDVPGEVLRRLQNAGFRAEKKQDGLLGTRRRPDRSPR